jgi:hypothetical protein
MIAIDQLGWVVAGTALIVGAITSYKGIRTWFWPSIWDGDEPQPTRVSGTMSATIGAIGLLITAMQVWKHVSSVRPSRHSSHDSSIVASMLLIVGLNLFVLIYAFRTGTIIRWNGYINRWDAPFVFWLCVGASVVCNLSFLFVLFG